MERGDNILGKIPLIFCQHIMSTQQERSNAEKMTFGIFYLLISKMLGLFKIKGQGKAQHGNFQTPILKDN